MLHGFPVDHRLMKGCFEPIFRNLSAWKRIYVDLPGMGRSKASAINNADEMLEALIELLHAVVPDPPFAVAGESYGCHIARGILHKLHARVKGLLLICPVVYAESARRTLPPFIVRRRDDAFMKRLKSKEKGDFESIAVVQTEKTWKRFQKEIAPGLRRHDADFCNRFQQTGYGLSLNFDEPSTPFEKPVLILTGRQDQIVGHEDGWKLARTYPRASFAVLDCAGHNLQIEQPAVFNSLVAEWLDRVKKEW